MQERERERERKEIDREREMMCYGSFTIFTIYSTDGHRHLSIFVALSTKTAAFVSLAVLILGRDHGRFHLKSSCAVFAPSSMSTPTAV